MAVQSDLVAAVEADPDDLETQLVLADWLQSIDDERGELIALDLRDRASVGNLTEPAAIERLLVLAAEYGFPNARDPRPPALAFARSSDFAVQYDVEYEDHHYRLRYYNRQLTIAIDHQRIETGERLPSGLTLQRLERDAGWTRAQAQLIFAIVSDAIRAGTPLMELVLPFSDLQLPVHLGAALRVYALPIEFTQPRGLARDRYGLAARDYHRWHAIWNRLGRM